MTLLEIKSKLSYSEYVTLELSSMRLLGNVLRFASAHFKPLVTLAVSSTWLGLCTNICKSGASISVSGPPAEGANTPLELAWENFWVVLMPLLDELWKRVSVTIKCWNVKDFVSCTKLMLKQGLDCFFGNKHRKAKNVSTIKSKVGVY